MLELTITTDCTLITIGGLFIADGSAFIDIDEGNGETIQTATLKVWKGCDVCSNCADEAYLNEFTVSTLTTTNDYTSDASGNLILNSTTFLQTAGVATAALSDTVYHVDVYIDGIDDDVITAEKFDESTAFPLKSVDTGSTAVARTGADGDTLEYLSDEIAGVATASGQPALGD